MLLAANSQKTRFGRNMERSVVLFRLGIPGVLAALLLALALCGSLLAPYSPTDFSSDILVAPSLPHLMGTDEYGRDVFSRILTGAFPTLIPAFASALLGIVLGALTGLSAGYYGGHWDQLSMRFMDVLLSFPSLVFAMLIVVVLGGDMLTLTVAIGLVFWPKSAKLIRSGALDLAKRDYVEAARARGESGAFIILRELLPNMWGLIIAEFSVRCSFGILLAASLSYLGIGVQPPTPAWGLMVKEGQQFIQFASWLVIFPCVAIALVSITTVLLGERIRRIVIGADGWSLT